jgi:hypothetical protein
MTNRMVVQIWQKGNGAVALIRREFDFAYRLVDEDGT